MLLRFFVFFVVLPFTLLAYTEFPNFSNIVDKLLPAVVDISTEQKVPVRSRAGVIPQIPRGHFFEEFREFFWGFPNFPGEDREKEKEIVSVGSGFVIDKSGIIVTNRHVIASQDGASISNNITVTFYDNSKLKAKVLATDIRTDLAVLKVDADKDLYYIEFADSDRGKVGDWVIAIGNPFGLGRSVSVGIISARGRDINMGQNSGTDYIQTDASMNFGSSGGPLFNLDGKVIGVNTAIISPSGGNVGIGFAVPSSVARPVVSQLALGKAVERGWIGVKVQEVTDVISDSIGQKSPYGALVVEVVEGGPAHEAGIEVGDVVTNFNGKGINKMSDLLTEVSKTKNGDVVDVAIKRDSSNKKGSITLKLKVKKLEERDTFHGDVDTYYDEIGIKVSNLSSDMRERYHIKSSINGVVVTDVQRSLNKVLLSGDVIMRVGSKYVKNVEEFNKVLKSERKKSNSVLLLVNRGGDSVFIGVKFAQ